MTREQEQRIENECGWTLMEFAQHEVTGQRLWTYWADNRKDSVIFIETHRGAKYAVCDGKITQWTLFKDFRNMLNFLKEIA
jgi:hypothetical protein